MSSSSDRKAALEKLRQSESQLDRFADPKTPPELLHFRPAVEDAWTIQEHIVHLFDCDMIFLIWIKKAIAEPGSAVWATGPITDVWPRQLNYSDQPLLDTIEAFKRIRKITYCLFKSIEDREWGDCYVVRPDGQKRTLIDLLNILPRHVNIHEEYFKRNESQWQEQTK